MEIHMPAISGECNSGRGIPIAFGIIGNDEMEPEGILDDFRL